MMVTCTFPHRRRGLAGHGILSASMGPGPDQHIMVRVPPQPKGTADGELAGRGEVLHRDSRAGPAVLTDTRHAPTGSINPRIAPWRARNVLLGTGLTVVVDGEPEQKR